ncbi:M28 family peptidase [Alkalimonas sp.]|uniref:M28 family peptidase n=1 Tax=Alkalimonas sp. TaxID=1872453 RepID=UPI00263B496A|nr:M28 family peptidase [Alkalimonas sp.]MCC5826448.1 M28 family peptidase [Alkalimonas sp.]
MKKLSKGIWCCFAWLCTAVTLAEPSPTAQLLLDIQQLSSEQMQGRETGTAGAAKARTYLKERFRQLELTPWQGSYQSHFVYYKGRRQQSGINLIGWLPGCDEASGSIVITAHYDHLGMRGNRVYYGANDNASGVAVLLAIAGKLQLQAKPCLSHHYFFVATDAEENGLHGSRAFVENPPVPLEQMLLNINLDMLARAEPQQQLFITGARRYPELRRHLQQQPGELRLTFLTHRGPQRRGSLLQEFDWPNSSDHAHFHRAGIPYLFFGGMPFADYHTAQDHWQSIKPEMLEQVFTVIWQTILWVEASSALQLRPTD